MRARTCLNRHVLIGGTKFSGQTRRPILIGEPNAHQTIAPEELGKVRSLAQSNEIAVSPKRRQRPAPAPTRVRRRQPRSRDPESRARTPTNPLRRCDVHETRTCPVTPGQLRLTQPDPEAVGVLQTRRAHKAPGPYLRTAIGTSARSHGLRVHDRYRSAGGSFPGPRPADQPAGVRHTHPAPMPMDAWRSADGYHVALDLPGVDPGSTELTVDAIP